jgi:hypothetical protein
VVIEPDSLVKLEHGMSKDRVRKAMFNRVSQVAVWRTVPWIRISIVVLFFVFPGFLLFALPEEPAVKIVGFLLFALGVTVGGVYLYCGKTTFRIVLPGKTEDITGIFRPGTVSRAVAKITSNIRAAQAVAGPAPAAPPVIMAPLPEEPRPS